MSELAAMNVPELAFAPIDQDHERFAQMVKAMQHADNATFVSLFEHLLEHTEAHFARENALMEMTDFPAKAEHRGEHHRVLAELKQFQQRVQRGQIQFAKTFCLNNMVDWFKLHVTSMDSALVAHALAQAKLRAEGEGTWSLA